MILAFALTALAEEGMWLPDQLPELAATLQAAGLQAELDDLAPGGGLLGAVAYLGNCTASFVSEDGLLLTNAHCVRSLMQHASLDDEDLVKDGFYAATRADERSGGPQARLYVLEGMRDVTDQVHTGIDNKTSDLERHRIVEANRVRLSAGCAEGRRCDVARFDGGARYVLVEQTELRDLRLVYAPPDALAMFGGEDDNWMWPRHTADVALVRAYVGADGPAAFDEGNVPYQPEHHLTVSSDGVDDGDFVLMAGYPWTTARNGTASELRQARDVRYRDGVELFAELMAALKVRAKDSADAHRRVNEALFTLSNAGKSYLGMLDNFDSQGLVQAKADDEAALHAWVDEKRSRQKRYADGLEELEQVLVSQHATAARDRLVGLTGWYPQLLRTTRTAYRLALESEKPDEERRRGYQQRDRQGLVDGIDQLDRSLYLRADMDVMRILLTRSQELPEGQRIPPLDAWLAEVGGIEAGLTQLFSRPQLASHDARMALMEATRADLEASTDPWVQLAVAMERWRDSLEDEADATHGALLRLRPIYIDALRASGGAAYPDANGTVRVSYGRIAGYAPAEAVTYGTRTTLQGMIAKHGASPFEVPVDVRARATTAGPVPLNFLSTLDNTGGNSGSPTLNAQGEVVGVVFDRNWEGMAADWRYTPEMTRSIHVDVRFLAWLLRDIAGDTRVLEELGLDVAESDAGRR